MNDPANDGNLNARTLPLIPALDDQSRPPEFDAKDWILQADATGMKPVVIYQPDGRRGIFIRETGSGNYPLLVDSEQMRAVINELKATGRSWQP